MLLSKGSAVFKNWIHKTLDNHAVLSVLILLKIAPSPKCFAHLLQCINQGHHERICHLDCALRWWMWCITMSRTTRYNWVKQGTFYLVFWLFAFSIIGRNETSRRRYCSKSKHTPENCPYSQVNEIHDM